MATDHKPTVGTHASNYRNAGLPWDAVPTETNLAQSQKDTGESRYDTLKYQSVEPVIWKRFIAVGRHLFHSIPNPPLDLEQGPSRQSGFISPLDLTQGNVVCHRLMNRWGEQIDGTGHQFSFFSITDIRSTSSQRRTERNVEWM
jgi:hypothetical protein